MICPHCGRETRESSAFCTQCGQVLRAPAPTRTGGPQPPPTPSPVPQPIAVPAPVPPGSRDPRIVAVVIGGLAIAAAIGVGATLARHKVTPVATPVSTNATGDVFGRATPAPATAAPAVQALPDCSRAIIPPQGSPRRKVVLDGIRRHEGYSGLYVVSVMTIMNGWAYTEAHHENVDEPDQAYVLQFDGALWNWRWQGRTGPTADITGSPPYPADFTGPARDVLRC